MTRPTDWDFSKVSGDGKMPASAEPPHGEMPAFAIHIEKRSPYPEEALPWADVEFERISKSPRRAEVEPAPSVPMAKRRFPRFRVRWAFQLPHFKAPRLTMPHITMPRMPRVAMPAIALPRLSLPRFTMPRMSMPSVALPRVTIPDFVRPRVKLPSRPVVPRPAMPHFAAFIPDLPDLHWVRSVVARQQQLLRHRAVLAWMGWRRSNSRVAARASSYAVARQTKFRTSLIRGWRACAAGLWVVGVVFQWLGAELIYFIRLAYAHAHLFLSRSIWEVKARASDKLSGTDFRSLSRPVVKQLAVVGVFVAAGYGAAQIVRPVLQSDGARLAARSAQPVSRAEPIAAETQAVIASLDEAVPLPMPRIAHASIRTGKHALIRAEKGEAAPVQATSIQADERDVARRLMPASQTHRRGNFYGSNLISEIQIRLLRLGYPVGPPTGMVNAKTRRSILLYQRDALLPVSGEADMRLLGRLRDTEGRNARFAGR